MLRWAFIFLIISIIAAVFGFGGLSETAADFAKVLFYIFLGIFVLMLIAGLVTGNRMSR